MRTFSRYLLLTVVSVHGLLHLLGATKGLGWAQVPSLRQPISAPLGVAWLAVAGLVLAAGALLAFRARHWWIVTAAAAVASQVVVATSWDDAKAGTAANAVLLVGALYGWAGSGPGSLPAEYRRRLAAATGATTGATTPAETPAATVTEADLARLPAPVARYLRRSGAVGRPRVRTFRATIHGRIRAGADRPWMPFTGEQFDDFGPRPRRLFLLDATMAGLPVDVLHVLDDGTATMRARACSLVTVMRGAGPELDRAEAVTLFNDLCLLAPAALVDAPVTWQVLADRRVRGTYSSGGQTVSADLVFDEAGDLADFESGDRLRADATGASYVRQRWSTPVRRYRDVDGRRVVVDGDARWHAPQPEGEFTYLEFAVDEIAYGPITGTTSGEAGDMTGPGRAARPEPAPAVTG